VTSRKRKTGESFKQYRENLRAEERAFKTRLSGHIVWSAHRGTYYRDPSRRQATVIKNRR
jgi:hypothetical protein